MKAVLVGMLTQCTAPAYTAILNSPVYLLFCPMPRQSTSIYMSFLFSAIVSPYENKSKLLTFSPELLAVSVQFICFHLHGPNPPPPSPLGILKKKINTGRFHPEGRPLTLLYNIFGRKGIPFVYLLDKWYPFRIPTIGKLIKGPFKYPNDRFPYPFIYLKREKDTPFGQSLPV